ncbi:hypothetical protein RUM44_001656 [Polyplax serrata]|uniref:Uncharacterized protein n=1 Tax=Polyplax serrata TaxID=468196 RepID=A0ABR1AM57_POLSC
MVTRYSTLGGKEPTIHCFMPGYNPQLRLLSATPNREVPTFHASGTPGGGPGMRGMHHAPPTQPPTPPMSQDIKQPPTHLQPQTHQMPPQSGGQIMQYSLPGTGRGSTQQTPFYAPSRAPLGNQRMAHARPSVVMPNNQSFMSQQVLQPVFQGHVIPAPMSGQGPVFVAPPMNQPFQIQQPRHQSSSYYSTTQLLLPQPPMFHYSQQAMYYTQSLQPMSRAGGPAPSSQGSAPTQPQPIALISNHGGTMMSNPGVSQQVKASRPKKVLEIIDPKDGRNILLTDNDNTSRSGESSARQTPQPNAGQKTDQGVAVEFATRVAIAAKVDHSGSPNPPALQKSSSRTSNFSESESQASPDPQGMSTPSVSPSKLDTSVESISNESQVVENNVTYDANQPSSMMRGGWTSVANIPVEILPMRIHTGMMIPDDMMRSGSLPNQPTRDYQAMQQPTQWMSDGNQMPMVIGEESATQIESSVRPERVTPVVSALAHAPTVDIGPRPQREQFPVLGKGHQQQSPVKRKQRPEQSQEPQSEGKVKEQQSKLVAQSKHKSPTPGTDIRKQQSPPSQDSDEYVQSVQMKSSEPKTTIIIKKNDSDSSGTKTKSDDSLKAKENNNVETRNLTEETTQDGSRSKSEVLKCDVAMPKDRSPTPPELEPPGKKVEETENGSSSTVSEPATVVTSSTEETILSRPNGDATIEEDGKFLLFTKIVAR